MIIIARKSKRNQISHNLIIVQNNKQMKEEKEFSYPYQTAIYIRISKEECENTNTSINNQVFMLRHFIEGKDDLALKSLFIDNGRTGTNFTRPSFIRMMESVENGTINCIVVKDLSRLGRNYIDAGKYLENIFPLLGVRFISVNDQYDSIYPNSDQNIKLSVKNLINEAYARDISKKIRSSFEKKKRDGEYLASLPPYGYVRRNNHDNHLYKDENAAQIVEVIFKDRAIGKSYTQIAKELNCKNIVPPNLYKYQRGLLKDAKKVCKYWGPKAVKDITNNQVYLGNMIHNRSKQVPGDRKRQSNREDFIIVERTHEAIISKALFDTVRNINQSNGKKSKLGDGDLV